MRFLAPSPRGEGWGEGSLLKFVPDAMQHGLHIDKHFAIREPHDTKATSLQIDGSGGISRYAATVRMLATINLDHQAALEAAEIQDVWAEGLLTSELGLGDLPRPQPPPKRRLSVRT